MFVWLRVEGYLWVTYTYMHYLVCNTLSDFGTGSILDQEDSVKKCP